MRGSFSLVRKATLILIGALLLLAACSAAPSHPPQPMDWQSSYTVAGDPAVRGQYPITAGMRLSQAVRAALAKTGRPGPMTIVLIQRGPEGETRHIIDLDADLQPKNLHDDYFIRGGDEIVLPAVKPQ